MRLLEGLKTRTQRPRTHYYILGPKTKARLAHHHHASPVDEEEEVIMTFVDFFKLKRSRGGDCWKESGKLKARLRRRDDGKGKVKVGQPNGETSAGRVGECTHVP